MKKSLLISITAFLLKANACFAQIPNAGFENLNSDGTIQNWGNVYIFSVGIDSTGTNFGDSVVFDNYFYSSSNDAKGGVKALQLCNAWNFTTNLGIAGAAGVDEDTIFSSWGLLNLIPTNATLLAPFAPINFGFDYKFFPVNGDSAYAEIALYDSSGNDFAHGVLLISDSALGYKNAFAPISYLTNDFAAYYSLSIHNFYTASPGYKQPSLGTRLIVDNVGFNLNATNTNDIDKPTSNFNIYPIPALNEISIQAKNRIMPFQIQILNADGAIVMEEQNQTKINISKLPSGLYYLNFKQGELLSSKKFIKH